MRTGTPGFVAGRLTEGREARGFTQTSLSELTGIKSQSISHYEQGRQSPSPEALALLCETLELPERFFLRPAPPCSSAGIFFRQGPSPIRVQARLARIKAERHLVWLQEITDYVCRFVDLPEDRLPFCPVRALTSDPAAEIESIADSVRAAFGAGSGPLGNLTPLLEQAGCIVTRCSMDSELEGSYSRYAEGRPYLALRAEETRSSWARYIIAHELGHLVMHRHLPHERCSNTDSHRILELQADRFARAFLLPARVFASEVWAPTIDALLTLKKEWLCPVSVMVCRCGEIGAFDADQLRRATVNLVRRGWKAAEPREDAPERETPQLLARSFRLLIDEGLRDRHTILTELALNSSDVENLCGLAHGYLGAVQAQPTAALRLRRDEQNEVTPLL